MNRADALDRIDPLLAELRRIDERLDGKVDPDTGEFTRGALAVLEEAEGEWLPHRDALIAELAEGDYKGRQLPGEDKLDALTRRSSPAADQAWRHFRHYERLTKALRERAARLDTEIKGLQSIAKRPDEPQANDMRGLPQHARRRMEAV